MLVSWSRVLHHHSAPFALLACAPCQVTRDRIIEDWRWSEPNLDFSEDRSFGSGYPGDERCKKWLETNIDFVFGFPDICRFSWGTTKELLKGGAGKRVDW